MLIMLMSKLIKERCSIMAVMKNQLVYQHHPKANSKW